MNIPLILGMVAGFLTTASFVPQVIRTWKRGSADDLSYGMLFLFLVGLGLWLIYGLILESLPIIVANIVTIVLVILLIWMKSRYSDRIVHA
ncbi:MAG: SemiSWEET transporter [Methanomicrobiales archaeon]|nr:SemiSWEET transporter [Methanomicrobiales archaeon]